MGNPAQPNLPPGFRFHPTDEELILHYLMKKVASVPLPVSIIADVDIYKFDPWELPAKAAFGEKEWYFFSPRDRKYPNGARPNRAASSGYWKATGTDKTIAASSPGGGVHEKKIGVKKALVFYKGKAPKGEKTNWIMHEYRLVDNSNRPIKLKESSMRLDDWVLCRIYRKSKFTLSPKIEAATLVGEQDQAEEKVFKDTLFPFSKSPPPQNTLISQKSVAFPNPLDAMDYSILSRFLSYQNNNSNNPPGFGTSSGLNCGNLDQQFSQNNNNTSNSYLLLKHSQLNPSVPYMENFNMRPKRQLSNIDEDTLHPSKKYLSSSCNTNAIYENPQWNFLLKQSLLNQQLLRFHR